MYNLDFNCGEFAKIRNQSGLNGFKINVKEFVARTNAISLQAKAGRYGGTYAHKGYTSKEFDKLDKPTSKEVAPVLTKLLGENSEDSKIVSKFVVPLYMLV